MNSIACPLGRATLYLKASFRYVASAFSTDWLGR